MSASVDCKEPTYLACKAKPMRVNPLTPRAFIFSLKYHPWITHKGHWNKTSNNQRLVKCVQSLVREFLMYWLRRKKIGVFSSRWPRKHLHMRSKLFEPHSQPVLNGAQCLKSHGITIDPLGTGP